MKRSIILCMFIFIILLSLLSWLSHNKLKRDHYESFWVDTEETPDKPLGYGAVNAASAASAASTVILNPTSLTKKDIIEKVDVGTQSYKEASYYLIPMITKVKTALYNLNADYAKLTDEEKKLKKELEALLKELNRLQSIITELKNNDNAGKRGLTAADYTKLNKIINAKENILSLVNQSIKDIDTKLLMEHFTDNMDTNATPGDDTTGDIGTGGGATIQVETVDQVNSQVMGYSSQIDEQHEQVSTKDFPQTYTNKDDTSETADGMYRSAREICESKVNTCYVRNTDETTDLTYELKNTIHVFDDNNYECTENREGCIDGTDYNCPFDSCFFVNGAIGKDYQYYTSNVIRDATIDNDDNILCIKSDDLCQYSTEAAIKDKVRSNCEGGGSGDIMGNNHVPKYKCWTTTGGLIDSKASLAYPENWSKTWTDTVVNDDGMAGSCTMNENCRTESDAKNEESCLSSTSGSNYQCYTKDGVASDSPRYRKTFNQGKWDANMHSWVSGTPYCTTNGSIDNPCRTKDDVDTEKACLKMISDGGENYECWALTDDPTIDHENATDQLQVTIDNYTKLSDVYRKTDRKFYEAVNNYANNSSISPVNNGKGTCKDRTDCRSREKVLDEIDCYNQTKGNYQCWNVDYNDANSEHTVYATGTEKMLKTYDRDASTCSSTNDNCSTKEQALDNARKICLYSDYEINRCWKIDPSVADNSKEKTIVPDQGDVSNFFENGSRVKFEEIKDTKGNVIEGKCVSRDCRYTSPEDLCASQKQTGYTDGSTIQEELPMKFNKDTGKCEWHYSSKPYCSYKTIVNGNETDHSSSTEIDCSGSAGNDGKKYEWLMECVGDVCIPFDNSRENDNCVRDTSKTTTFPSNPKILKENIVCPCPSLSDNRYSTHYQTAHFTSQDYTDNDGNGYSSIDDAQSNLCERDPCLLKTVYTIDTKKSQCDGEKHQGTLQTTQFECVNCVRPAVIWNLEEDTLPTFDTSKLDYPSNVATGNGELVNKLKFIKGSPGIWTGQKLEKKFLFLKDPKYTNRNSVERKAAIDNEIQFVDIEGENGFENEAWRCNLKNGG